MRAAVTRLSQSTPARERARVLRAPGRNPSSNGAKSSELAIIQDSTFLGHKTSMEFRLNDHAAPQPVHTEHNRFRLI